MVEAGLYIHIPFCEQKCHYCDFISYPEPNNDKDRFLEAVCKEIGLLADKYSMQLKTIFIGGGTPTILTGKQLVRLLSECRKQFGFSYSPEITIEANPGTLSKRKLKRLKKAGVNRLSLGVQTLDNNELKKLGRRHTVQDVVDNYYLARELGFENINLDLIFALPGQTLEGWRRTLRQVDKLNPEHISCYNLKLEAGTPLYRWAQQGKVDYISEELDLKMYQLAQKFLTQVGYKQYEISNFAQKGFQCHHNKIYWLNQPYLAAGPGAHFYTGQQRGVNLTDLEKYYYQLQADNLPIAEQWELSRKEKIEETLMLGLRLNKGLSLQEFKNRYDSSLFEIYGPTIKELREKELLEIKEGRLFLTERGQNLANRVLAKFILT